jgi:hypothetical protein
MCRLFQLFALGLVSIAMPSYSAIPAALIGEWEVRDTAMGAGRMYRFQSNGTYEYRIFRILPGTTQVIKSEAGTYIVQGNRLTLQPQGGDSRIYGWQITRDPYVGDRILWLENPSGVREQFLRVPITRTPSTKFCTTYVRRNFLTITH